MSQTLKAMLAEQQKELAALAEAREKRKLHLQEHPDPEKKKRNLENTAPPARSEEVPKKEVDEKKTSQEHSRMAMNRPSSQKAISERAQTTPAPTEATQRHAAFSTPTAKAEISTVSSEDKGLARYNPPSGEQLRKTERARQALTQMQPRNVPPLILSLACSDCVAHINRRQGLSSDFSPQRAAPRTLTAAAPSKKKPAALDRVLPPFVRCIELLLRGVKPPSPPEPPTESLKAAFEKAVRTGAAVSPGGQTILYKEEGKYKKEIYTIGKLTIAFEGKEHGPSDETDTAVLYEGRQLYDEWTYIDAWEHDDRRTRGSSVQAKDAISACAAVEGLAFKEFASVLPRCPDGL